MHRPIEDGLEDYLGGKAEPSMMKKFYDHLASCVDCRGELDLLEQHSQALRNLRADVEPPPGFYARVLERIDLQRNNSFWSLLMEPLVVRPIMYASFCLLVVFASAVWSTGVPSHSSVVASTPVGFLAAGPMPVADGADPHHDRTVVLTNLASVSDGGGPEFLPTSTD